MARTVPVSSTQAPGNFITGALWNAGPAASNTFLTAVPMAVLVQATPQTVTSGAQPVISFDSTVYDGDGGHSNVTNNSRYTCQVPGWCLVIGLLSFAVNATGNRAIQTAKNGVIQTRGQQILPAAQLGNGPDVQCASLVQLAVGDYVELIAFQSSGGNLATVANSSSMEIFWIHS